MRACVAVVGAAFGGLLGGQAAGQQVTIEPAVEGRLTYTDNSKFGSGGERTSDFVMEAAPRISIHRRGPRVTLDGSLSLDVIHYARRTLSDQLVPTGALSLNALLVEDMLGFDAALSASQPHLNPFGAAADGPSVDTATAGQLRLSPYVDYKFSPETSLYARADNTWSHVTGADTGNVPLHGSVIQNDVARFEIKPRPIGVTVEALREDTRFQGEQESALTIEAARVVGWYGLDPDQAVGLVAGSERTRFLLSDSTDPIYGLRMTLRPGRGRYVNGTIERRFFGAGWNISLGEATSLYAVNLMLRRGPFTFPAALNLTPANGNVAEALDAALLSRYPDPVARARAVQQLISSRGLPTNLAQPFTIFSSNAQLNQSVEASAVLMGRRDTITLFAMHSRIETLLRKDSGQSYVPSFSTDNTQLSVGVDYNHRLTPLTNLDVVVNATRLVGLGSLADSQSKTLLLRAAVNTQLTPRTTGTFGLRHQTLKSTVSTDDHESAGFVGVAHRF